METYNGIVRTPADAIILFEACRLGLLPRVQRRLSEKERQSIRSGSVFVWDEREAGMRRWTDGKSWSASRVSGSFLTYREMEGKRGGNGLSSNNRTPENGRASADLDSEEGPDGYRYKPDGLMKQSFSITTSTGQHLHLISYYSRNHPTAPNLQQPTQDHTLRHIRPQKGMYPESTINDQSNVPAVTRSPMIGAPPYAHMSPPPGYPRHATHPHSYISAGYHPAYAYPPSPMGTPPAGWPIHYPPGMPPISAPIPHGLAYPPHLQGHPPPHHYIPPRPAEHSAPPPLNHPPASSPPIQPPPAYAPAVPSPISAPPSNDGKSPKPRTQSGLQIDPRLTGADAPQNSPNTISAPQGEPKQETQYLPPVAEAPYPAVSASEIPSIGNLVNGAAAAAAAVIAKSEADAKAARKEAEERRSASRSPGGTKKGPKDIPSEKLGFGEDKRALRQLDKVFIP